MKVFEWIPNKSIGDLVFNMTREDARKAMGNATYTPWFKGRSDIYRDYSMRLDYDENGLLESVEFLGMEKGFFEVWYKGKLIYPKLQLSQLYSSYVKPFNIIFLWTAPSLFWGFLNVEQPQFYQNIL